MIDQDLIQTLKTGGIAVIRTDTLYGIVARAEDSEAVARVYAAKERSPDKSPIVLIDSMGQLFDTYDERTLELLKNHWPGPYSIILPSTNAPDWITRGNDSVAYRLPDHAELRTLLRATGPLIAPSANPEGLPPASSIDKALEYFGDVIDMYIDAGSTQHTGASGLYQLRDDNLIRLR